MIKILIVDDERYVRNTIKELLEINDYYVNTAEDGKDALDKLSKNRYDLVITDIKMPNIQGDELLASIKNIYPDTSVIIISGHGSIDKAVECTKLGAYNFMEKPIDMNKLIVLIKEALSSKNSIKNTIKPKLKTSETTIMIGYSEAMTKVRNLILKVAPTDSRILITGNNGTGKELVAHCIYESSNRKDYPFIEVNCAAIPSELIESELFGHEKGSFTSALRQHKGKFEQAQSGTLFLDEIGDMGLSAQAKVLRALQENKICRIGGDKDVSVDVRIICATNKNLREEISNGRFREDLYHRLSVITIDVPSLKDRIEDIPILVDYFLDLIAKTQDTVAHKINANAISELQKHDWLGNIRELRNVVERLIILGDNPITSDNVKELVTVTR